METSKFCGLLVPQVCFTEIVPIAEAECPSMEDKSFGSLEYVDSAVSVG